MEGFTPLPVAGTRKKSGQEDFRVLRAQHPEQARPYNPAEPPSDLQAAAPASPGACQPRVSLQREGERITAIHIQCSCGQVIDLSCVYPEGK